MKKIFVTTVVVALFGAMFISCGGASKRTTQIDSISYVVGLNVAHSLMQMDSTLDVNSVCAAIQDAYNGQAIMTLEEARDYYLGQKTYFIHTRAQAHQEQYLADLGKRDRSYVRTRSGVTYKIDKLGDQNYQGSMNSRDTVRFVWTVRNEKGDVLCENDTLRTSYRDMLSGLQEVVRIAGSGAEFSAWLPSKTAYDTAGNAEMGVAPNELLNFEVKILDIKYNNPKRKR